MPYDIKKRGSKWVVVSRDSDRVLGTHGSWKKARAQQKAVYANVKEDVMPERQEIEKTVDGLLDRRTGAARFSPGDKVRYRHPRSGKSYDGEVIDIPDDEGPGIVGIVYWTDEADVYASVRAQDLRRYTG